MRILVLGITHIQHLSFVPISRKELLHDRLLKFVVFARSEIELYARSQLYRHALHLSLTAQLAVERLVSGQDTIKLRLPLFPAKCTNSTCKFRVQRISTIRSVMSAARQAIDHNPRCDERLQIPSPHVVVAT